jgi:hypothetical protein
VRIDLPHCNIRWSIDLDERFGCSDLTVIGRYDARGGEVLSQAACVPLHRMHSPDVGTYVVREITEKLTRAVGRHALGLDR